VSQKTMILFVHNCAKCWPILKILLPLDSAFGWWASVFMGIASHFQICWLANKLRSFVSSFRSCHEFFWGRLRQISCWISMQILKFAGFRSGCFSHRYEMNVFIPSRSKEWETLTRRLCALIELTHCFARRQRTHNRSRTWQAVTVGS